MQRDFVFRVMEILKNEIKIKGVITYAQSMGKMVLLLIRKYQIHLSLPRVLVTVNLDHTNAAYSSREELRGTNGQKVGKLSSPNRIQIHFRIDLKNTK